MYRLSFIVTTMDIMLIMEGLAYHLCVVDIFNDYPVYQIILTDQMLCDHPQCTHSYNQTTKRYRCSEQHNSGLIIKFLGNGKWLICDDIERHNELPSHSKKGQPQCWSADPDNSTIVDNTTNEIYPDPKIISTFNASNGEHYIYVAKLMVGFKKLKRTIHEFPKGMRDSM
jgi:hypothetical protein